MEYWLYCPLLEVPPCRCTLGTAQESKDVFLKSLRRRLIQF